VSLEISEFIDLHRAELKEAVGRALGHVPRQASCDCPKSGTDHYHPAPDLDDDDLEDWINNDEGLYNWARSEGVEI
jgi:hypothetical protein